MNTSSNFWKAEKVRSEASSREVQVWAVPCGVFGTRYFGGRDFPQS